MKKYDEAACTEAVEKLQGNDNLKTAFLIGDSIRMGYCGYTKKFLSDVANVFYPEDNCRFTQYTLVNLAQWKNHLPDAEKVDVVYWNNGHWDIAHWNDDESSLNSVEVYCDMLIRIYKKLRMMFPNAKIIYATTTPMNPKNVDWVNWRTNDEIRQYNAAAIECLKNFDIAIHDIFALLEDKPSDYYEDYCHLTESGFEYLGSNIADYIRRIMI